jgi:hypothetical protein
MTVSSSTSRVQFNGNGSTTVFAYSFKIFDEDDLTVIVRSANGTETVKTITTHYTVSGVGNAGGGNVTMLTAPASGETLTILREQDLVQELDLVENDPFPSQSVEDALDKLTFIVQQHDEELGRAIKASRTNTISGSEFTISAADRANKVFAFDSSGNVSIAQELGTYRGNWAAGTAYNQRDLIKDTSNNNIYICLVAHTSTGSQPITSNADVAKWALIVDAAAAAASAAEAASYVTDAETAQTAAEAAQAAAEAAQAAAETAETNAETAETNAETAQAAAEAAQAAAEAVYDNFDDRYLGAKSSNPSVDNDGNALITGALYFNTTAGEMRVYSGSAWVAAYLPASGYVTLNGTETLTNKTITYADNTLTGVAGVTATQTLTNKTLTDPAIIGTILEDVFTITDGAAFEIDPGNGSIQLITLGANRTPKATNFANGEAVTLMVDDGTAYALTWTDATFGGSGVVWKTDGGVAPTLNTTGYTVIVLFEVGGQVYGARVGDA